MTKEEIIKMARKAGVTSNCDYPDDWLFNDEQLERFIAIVAANERDSIKQSLRHSLAVGAKTIQSRVYLGNEVVSFAKIPVEEVLNRESRVRGQA